MTPKSSGRLAGFPSARAGDRRCPPLPVRPEHAVRMQGSSHSKAIRRRPVWPPWLMRRKEGRAVAVRLLKCRMLLRAKHCAVCEFYCGVATQAGCRDVCFAYDSGRPDCSRISIGCVASVHLYRTASASTSEEDTVQLPASGLQNAVDLRDKSTLVSVLVSPVVPCLLSH